MEEGKDVAVYGGGGDSLMNDQRQKRKMMMGSSNQDSVFASSAPSNSFLGSRTMVSFGALNGLKRSGNLLFGCLDQDESGDEYFDEYYNQPEKKKRLTVEQVQFLEKSFELENKLEPERKVQLAKELGLQPRQIAVWFQNRRARWKTKQLETEYETLHASYKSLKTGYDNLLEENEKLKAEVRLLKGNGLGSRDFDKATSELHVNQELMSEATEKIPNADAISENEGYKMQAVSFKSEEHSSDVSNVDSPHLTDGNHSPHLESGESSCVFEPHQAEFLRTEEDNLNEELLRSSYVFPKMEDPYCHLPASSCNFGFPVEDHAFGFWSY